MRNKPVISLSTSYLQSKFRGDGYGMLLRAAELGYEYVELGHSTTVNSVEGIFKALDEKIVKVSSLHNFCPVPPFAKGAAPNLFSPATKSKMESELWLRHTKNTIDFAAQFGAKAVVCHCGFLSYFFSKPSAALEKFLAGHKDGVNVAENAEYKKILAKFMSAAKRKSERADYKYISKNIRAIDEFAKEKNILIGLENREGADELPLDWNFEVLVDGLKNDTQAKSWHDVGHSMRKQLLGMGSQLDLVGRTADSLIGWHLHDCTKEGKDHIAVGKGCIDFKALAKFFNPQKHIFTLELNRAVSPQDAADSLKRVQDLF